MDKKNEKLKLKNTNFIGIIAIFREMKYILMKQQYLTSFVLVNKILNILLVTRMIKNRPLCKFFPKMSTYRSFNKNNCMYFMIKEKSF